MYDIILAMNEDLIFLHRSFYIVYLSGEDHAWPF